MNPPLIKAFCTQKFQVIDFNPLRTISFYGLILSTSLNIVVEQKSNWTLSLFLIDHSDKSNFVSIFNGVAYSLQ